MGYVLSFFFFSASIDGKKESWVLNLLITYRGITCSSPALTSSVCLFHTLYQTNLTRGTKGRKRSHVFEQLLVIITFLNYAIDVTPQPLY